MEELRAFAGNTLQLTMAHLQPGWENGFNGILKRKKKKIIIVAISGGTIRKP